MKQNFALALHGGAGALSPDKYSPQQTREYSSVLKAALDKGADLLSQGESSTHVCCQVVSILEDSPLFNAGKGSVFNAVGRIEMDASIMSGENGSCGGVVGIKSVKNPILLALDILKYSPHNILAGAGAEAFAREHQHPFASMDYFFTKKRWSQLIKAQAKNIIQLDHAHEPKKMGTVGCVAIDRDGHLAAATSSGGLTNRSPGRVSDSSIIGAGTYAENALVAISGTGTGDIFIKNVLAYDMAALMKYADLSLNEAAQRVLQRLQDDGGSGGLIAIDHSGEITMPFCSNGMIRASINKQGKEVLEIF